MRWPDDHEPARIFAVKGAGSGYESTFDIGIRL